MKKLLIILFLLPFVTKAQTTVGPGSGNYTFSGTYAGGAAFVLATGTYGTVTVTADGSYTLNMAGSTVANLRLNGVNGTDSANPAKITNPRIINSSFEAISIDARCTYTNVTGITAKNISSNFIKYTGSLTTYTGATSTAVLYKCAFAGDSVTDIGGDMFSGFDQTRNTPDNCLWYGFKFARYPVIFGNLFGYDCILARVSFGHANGSDGSDKGKTYNIGTTSWLYDSLLDPTCAQWLERSFYCGITGRANKVYVLGSWKSGSTKYGVDEYRTQDGLTGFQTPNVDLTYDAITGGNMADNGYITPCVLGYSWLSTIPVKVSNFYRYNSTTATSSGAYLGHLSLYKYQDGRADVASPVLTLSGTFTDNASSAPSSPIYTSVSFNYPWNTTDFPLPNASAFSVTATAGSDQTIVRPTSSATLSGSGTPVGSGNTITSYSWSGPGTFSSTTIASPTVTNIPVGSNNYVLTVTDGHSNTASDNVTIIAHSLVTSNAGPDETLSPGQNTDTLAGSGVSNGGSVLTYLWSQSSGPNTAAFSSTAIANPIISGLAPGTYVFHLVVQDSDGQVGSDNVSVTVVAGSNLNGIPYHRGRQLIVN